MDDIFVSGTKQQPRGRDDKADRENYKKKASKEKKREKAKSQDDGEQEENRCQPRQSIKSEQIKAYGQKKEGKKEKMTKHSHNITKKKTTIVELNIRWELGDNRNRWI